VANETDEYDIAGSVRSTEAEIKQLLGMFDAPAFARRGREVEWVVRKTLDLCQRRRSELMDMVRCRLRMWANVTTGPGDWPLAFAAPIDHLWTLTDAVPPRWKAVKQPSSRVAAKTAAELRQSVERFNERWQKSVRELKAETVNHQIDRFNQFYVLEKECIVGSSRLASRLFVPQPRIEPEWLLEQLPLLPVPTLRQGI
jgi:hypothetical protein